MRGFATGVGSKSDIGAPPLTQLSFMSTRPRPTGKFAPCRARLSRAWGVSLGGGVVKYPAGQMHL